MGALVIPYGAIQQAFSEDPDAFHATVDTAADAAAKGDPLARARLVAEWHTAVAALESSHQGDTTLSTPQNGLASRLQTLIADRATKAGKTDTVIPSSVVTTTAGDSTAEAIVQVKFDENDLLGWLGTGLDVIFKPQKASFLPPPDVPESIPDDATIAMFSDWGTGLYGAPVIAKTIREKLARCDVVLHLGDTYYSGDDDEIKSHLVDQWPTRPGAINRALNGNHEMYSGGQGYFSALTTFFRQSSSCIALQNANWLILGLDTSYLDFEIDQAQIDWIDRMVAAAGRRKVILCSHHQPFSTLDEQGLNLQAALGRLLDAQRIEAWFWGHEHRLVVYEPHAKWGVKGRCIGHGGFPAFRDTSIGAGGNVYQFIHMKARPYAPEALILDGPNFWVTDGQDQYGPHGFVVLEFDGPNASETYRTPDNVGIVKWRL